MGSRILEKNINKFDDNLNDLFRKLGDTPPDMQQTPEAISNEIIETPEASSSKISKEVSVKNTWSRVKGFLKWLFTEFF